MPDTIIEEIRKVRDEFAREVNYDIVAMCDELRREQQAGGATVVSFPGRPVTAAKPDTTPNAPESASNIQQRFDKAMLSIFRRANSEAGYHATRFFQMLTEHRGLRTAQILLRAQAVSEGYRALWERGRLDLTVEALIHDNPEYHVLFSLEEIAIARQRLVQYQYPPVLRDVQADGNVARQ